MANKIPYGYDKQRTFFFKLEALTALKKLDEFFHGTINLSEFVNTAIIEYAKRTVKKNEPKKDI